VRFLPLLIWCPSFSAHRGAHSSPAPSCALRSLLTEVPLFLSARPAPCMQPPGFLSFPGCLHATPWVCL
jgi:hypothetical protein